MIGKSRTAEFSPGLVKSGVAREIAKRLPLRNIDKLLLFSALTLGAFGVLMVFSATRANEPSTYYLKRQLMFFILALVGMLLAASFDYRKVMPYSKILYVATLGLLIVVLAFPARGGSHRWISLSFFDFQPSEIAKVVVLLTLGTFLADRHMEICSNKEFLQALSISGGAMFFIFLEPNLGMTFMVFAITIGMLLVGGARWKQMMALAGGTVVAASAGMIFGLIKAYQMSRLLVFIKPNVDPLHAGYNLMQSKIAIGSGQLIGKGIFRGTQTRLEFIPEHHTDFIFSVVGEELGFIGSAILLILFAMLLWRALKIAITARDPFGTIVAIGIVVMFFFQILINVGMTMGIMPITGVPLPFMSYGGTSLIVNFTCIGLLLNIGMRRFPQGV
ncbi:MAG: rod shape-determining protein RodA [Candidatus Anoxymicrobium japonicum]|uniref:Peptidoglycan glycosyltransferase RodA n=1 Tax=Candidatus Anoxymicrobium japonicum TaxID=2013648 RepID=A0A2N3G7J0_9ACTN|nr:MAG: rod shape-determining protein RodA [Candidatus Anoxymicrobium japonicum]